MQLLNFRTTRMFPQLGQSSFFDSGIMVSKADNSAHSARIPDLAMHLSQIERCKQIPGKHCFSNPCETLAGRPLEFNPGTKNVNPFKQAKMRCRNMLVLRMRPQTIPDPLQVFRLLLIWADVPLHG